YSDVIKAALPQTSDRGELEPPLAGVVEPDGGERERFFAEARRRGFNFSPQAEHGHQVIKPRLPVPRLTVARTESWYRAALAAVVLLVAGASVFGGYQLGKARYSRGSEMASRPKDETSQVAARSASLPSETQGVGSPLAKSQFEAGA